MTDPVAIALISMIGTVLSGLIAWMIKRLGSVEGKVDGRFTALEEKVEQYQTEIIRLQQPGTTTPYGIPTEAEPVKFSAGIPMTGKTPKNWEKK